jgi:hypothetical protein
MTQWSVARVVTSSRWLQERYKRDRRITMVTLSPWKPGSIWPTIGLDAMSAIRTSVPSAILSPTILEKLAIRTTH